MKSEAERTLMLRGIDFLKCKHTFVGFFLGSGTHMFCLIGVNYVEDGSTVFVDLRGIFGVDARRGNGGVCCSLDDAIGGPIGIFTGEGVWLWWLRYGGGRE